MSLLDPSPPGNKYSLHWALVVSLIFHGLVLFSPRPSPKTPEPPQRLQVRLKPQTPASVPMTTEQPVARHTPAPPPEPHRRRKLLAQEKPGDAPAPGPAPLPPAQEPAGTGTFPREFDKRKAAAPGMVQRALAMAGAIGRQQAWRDDEQTQLLELIPDSPPVDPVGLELYLDGLVNKLNRSAAFVRNDPRSRGFKTATVLVRLDPGGGLQSFTVLNEADQRSEIAYIRSVVERAAPFPAFPPELKRSARALTMVICIFPANAGGLGFSRTAGRSC